MAKQGLSFLLETDIKQFILIKEKNKYWLFPSTLMKEVLQKILSSFSSLWYT